MSVEERLVDALSTFDEVEPSVDLFERVDLSVARDSQYRRAVLRYATGGGVVGLAVTLLVWSASDTGTIVGWAVLVAELLLLGAVAVAFGRLVPRFGRIFVEDVFWLRRSTATSFLRLQDTALHLIVSGYIVGWSWNPRMATRADLGDALGFLLDRTAGLLLLLGLLHAATLVALPIVGLVHASAVRHHSRASAGPSAPEVDPRAATADRYARSIVWSLVGVAGVSLLVAVGVALGLGIAG